MYEQPPRTDRLTWAEIRRLALRHKKSLWVANGVPTPIRILQRKDGEDEIDLRLTEYRGV